MLRIIEVFILQEQNEVSTLKLVKLILQSCVIQRYLFDVISILKSYHCVKICNEK